MPHKPDTYLPKRTINKLYPYAFGTQLPININQLSSQNISINRGIGDSNRGLKRGSANSNYNSQIVILIVVLLVNTMPFITCNNITNHYEPRKPYIRSSHTLSTNLTSASSSFQNQDVYNLVLQKMEEDSNYYTNYNYYQDTVNGKSSLDFYDYDDGVQLPSPSPNNSKEPRDLEYLSSPSPIISKKLYEGIMGEFSADISTQKTPNSHNTHNYKGLSKVPTQNPPDIPIQKNDFSNHGLSTIYHPLKINSVLKPSKFFKSPTAPSLLDPDTTASKPLLNMATNEAEVKAIKNILPMTRSYLQHATPVTRRRSFEKIYQDRLLLDLDLEKNAVGAYNNGHDRITNSMANAYFGLHNSCSYKYVQVFGRRVNAKATNNGPKNLKFVKLQLDRLSSDGKTVRIKNSYTGRYLCFDRQGRLSATAFPRRRGLCDFTESFSNNQFSYISLYDLTWKLGFGPEGHPINAIAQASYGGGGDKCYRFTKVNRPDREISSQSTRVVRRTGRVGIFENIFKERPKFGEVLAPGRILDKWHFYNSKRRLRINNFFVGVQQSQAKVNGSSKTTPNNTVDSKANAIATYDVAGDVTTALSRLSTLPPFLKKYIREESRRDAEDDAENNNIRDYFDYNY